MQQLLTGKKRLPNFSEKWVSKKLGEISRIKTGKRNGDEQVKNGKYPFSLGQMLLLVLILIHLTEKLF